MRRFALALCCLTLSSFALVGVQQAAGAAGCPGNPDALGTSRVLTVTPGEFTRLGKIQYPDSLPLNDHEVVLTFDDGPIPPYSTIVLDALAAQCVKATYFLVGEMAHAYPSLVRRIYNAGHTIGTHSQDHPFAFQRLTAKQVEQEVDRGIASVDAALGDPRGVSPFFRIPGFGRTKSVEHFLESKSLVTWSADVVADDWFKGITAKEIVRKAMRRLEARGRGILLLHDIHPATAMAVPALLKELKAGGYKVVQVVASGERPKSVPELVASAPERSGWPRIVRTSATSSQSALSAVRHHAHKLAGKQASADVAPVNMDSAYGWRSTVPQ
ncbi:MAG TPA: polysaccharide deacetylase family protein [Pseudolabrys sp.]|jgi:peptidoglycan/xylan/chitin deacetylase (PgdA/CDA1 family)|nr:polysaccharide deacetylase family protein [Pseudolabrys sp.]